MSQPVHALTTSREPVAGLHTYHRNPRQGDVAAIRHSLVVNGQYKPLVVNRGTHTGRPAEVLAGNHTLKAVRDLAWPDVAVCWVDVDDDQAARIVATDNRTADLGDYDDQLLAELLGGLPDLAGTGYDETDLDELVRSLSTQAGDERRGDAPSLADRFLIPPFTVLDARAGWWRERKRAWLDSTGITSYAGRGQHLAFQAVGASDPQYYDQKNAVEARLGRTLTTQEFEREHYRPSGRTAAAAGTSVFDPVLCEIVYRWFSPAAGRVLDPWAGGSVRGIVAAQLGRTYVGIDLSAEQLAANEEQAADAGGFTDDRAPRWILGDCLDVLPTFTAQPPPFDLIFGCPPYFNLERYSDDPRDLSAMSAEDFTAAYRTMLNRAGQLLAPDRFAVLVVGGARDSRGLLRDLRGLTVDAAAAAGLALYNEAVLVTPVGSARILAARSFVGSRILARTHQDVLVFVKGDRKRATEACGVVDVDAALAALDGRDDDDPAMTAGTVQHS
jgi:hypothetical protein